MSKTVIKEDDWWKIQLGDVVMFGNGRVRPQENGDIPIYGGNGILGYTSKANYNGETIVIGRVGAYCGSVYYENRQIWISDNALSAKPKDSNDAKYLFYFLKDLNLNRVAQGSSHPLVTQTLLNSLDVTFCKNIDKQKAIAEVLSSIDDKIDLLYRQNKTLEDMAQTLFRKWFVEEINKNWEEKPLDEIANYLNGLASQKYSPKNKTDKLPVLKIKELRNGFSKNSDWATSKVPDKYIIELGDVIFSWSGSLMIKIWNGKKCVLNQHLFKVTSEKYPKWFYYFWTKHYIEKFIAIADSKATTMGHIKRTDLSNSKVLIPPEENLQKMNSEIEPIFCKIILNYSQIRKLKSLSSSLLPRLMNGMVRVKF
jgi:type I restriction enzyme, S subunit